MAIKNKLRVIALEEHYWDAEVAKTFDAGEARSPELRKRLEDTSALGIKEMDEAGIDVQVLSHAAPSTQRLDAATAIPLAKRANDRLNETVRAHPDRFAAFAALPTADPKAAADELERHETISDTGPQGINGERFAGAGKILPHQKSVLAFNAEQARRNHKARAVGQHVLSPDRRVDRLAAAQKLLYLKAGGTDLVATKCTAEGSQRIRLELLGLCTA